MLDEPRLIDARLAGAGISRRPLPDRADLMARMVLGWRVTLVTTLLGATMASGWSVMTRPVYTATAEIFIDPRSIQALEGPANQGQGDNNAQVSFVESQTRIVTSEGVLSRVVASRKLDEDPLFDGEGGSSPLSAVARRFGVPAPAAHSAGERARSALIALADRVTVRRPERTFVMDVTVKADTADKSADLANAVAQAYFAEQAAAHADMARKASAALSGRLDDLRGRVREAESAVESFKAAHGLVGTRAQLSSEQQLVDANTQLAQAQGRLVLAQARYDETQHLSVSRMEGDTPEAVASPTVALLRGQQADAKRRLDTALEQFGPRHPAVHDAQAEVDGIRRSITSELTRIGLAARVEFRRAEAAVSAQQAAVDRLSLQAQRTSGDLLQLNQLEREVDIDKNLLDTFLSRSRQVGELGGIDATDGRVISAALPPVQRSFPPRGATVALFGALLGFAAGLGLSAKPWKRA